MSHHFSRLTVACFDVFCSDSVAVWGFAFFLSLLIAVRNSSVVISGILVPLIGVVVMYIDTALIFILSDFLFRFFLFIVVVYLFVEFSKDMGNPFSRRDGLLFLILYLDDEYRLLCRVDSWDVLYTFEVFKFLWMSCCLFIPFFCL